MASKASADACLALGLLPAACLFVPVPNKLPLRKGPTPTKCLNGVNAFLSAEKKSTGPALLYQPCFTSADVPAHSADVL